MKGKVWKKALVVNDKTRDIEHLDVWDGQELADHEGRYYVLSEQMGSDVLSVRGFFSAPVRFAVYEALSIGIIENGKVSIDPERALKFEQGVKQRK